MIPKTNTELMIQQGMSIAISISILAGFGFLVRGCANVPAYADVQDQITTYTTPYDNGEAEKTFLSLIQKAKHRIRMCCYGYTDDLVNQALIDAKMRGVDVGIVMDKTQASMKHQALLVQKLKDAGVMLWIGKSAVNHQLVHAKVTVFDDEIVESGSWNYSISANEQDNIVDIIRSKKRAKIMTDFINKIRMEAETSG